jgi:predicted dehydrogenase
MMPQRATLAEKAKTNSESDTEKKPREPHAAKEYKEVNTCVRQLLCNLHRSATNEGSGYSGGPLSTDSRMSTDNKIGYAVVGLGSIAQGAVLPAFQHAENSRLTALVSGDERKRVELGHTYKCRTYTYDQFEACLSNDEVDAIYICAPNHLHRRYAEAAARKGVHILCEKPLAPNEDDCRAIIETARTQNVRLMTAYRLHFERANLGAIRLCASGELGNPRIFNSVFCQQVAEGNIRLNEPASRGGGPLFDMGIYCINAARYLFHEEPNQVFAARANSGDKRFEKTEEMVSVTLRFPQDRLATFTVSFGAAPIARYSVIGTKGMLTANAGYEYSKEIRLTVEIDGKTTHRVLPRRDQFAAELIYFSDCIQQRKEPEPSGEEGLIDVQIISAAYRSAELRQPVPIHTEKPRSRPEPSQEIDRPPVEEPELVNARLPSGGARHR